MSDFDDVLALELGGWDPRYAVVLATGVRDSVAAALVDTNGDGADIDLDQYERGADGLWGAGVSGNCGEAGAFSTGFMGVAWGQVDPRTIIRLEFRASAYTVRASAHGWWMFVASAAPSDDVPKVVEFVDESCG